MKIFKRGKSQIGSINVKVLILSAIIVMGGVLTFKSEEAWAADGEFFTTVWQENAVEITDSNLNKDFEISLSGQSTLTKNDGGIFNGASLGAACLLLVNNRYETPMRGQHSNWYNGESMLDYYSCTDEWNESGASSDRNSLFRLSYDGTLYGQLPNPANVGTTVTYNNRASVLVNGLALQAEMGGATTKTFGVWLFFCASEAGSKVSTMSRTRSCGTSYLALEITIRVNAKCPATIPGANSERRASSYPTCKPHPWRRSLCRLVC